MDEAATRAFRASISLEFLLWLGETSEAVREAGSAETALGGRANNSLERVSATSIRAVALAQSGRLEQAMDAITSCHRQPVLHHPRRACR